VLLLQEGHREVLITIQRLEVIAGITVIILTPTIIIILAVLILIAPAAIVIQVVQLRLVPVQEVAMVEADHLVHPDKLADK
jgi:hypothetical protein